MDTFKQFIGEVIEGWGCSDVVFGMSGSLWAAQHRTIVTMRG